MQSFADPRRLWLRLLACALAGCLLAGLAAKAEAHETGKTNCEDVFIPVSIVAGGGKNYSIYGELCHPADGPSSVLQVLVHGYSYDHAYWSVQGFGGQYDYVAAANGAGYSTLAIDRIGSAGESSRPPAALITLVAGAVSLHDVIGAARAGEVPGGPYETVLTVGHSLGSAIAWIEASLYGSADGIISSGFGHPIGDIVSALLQSRAAFFDRDLRPLVGLDLGYLTTAPGSRGGLFYRAATSDPAVIAADEAAKGLGTVSELALVGVAEPATLLVEAPVLFVMGEYDNLFCLQAGALGGLVNCANDDTLYLSERAFFPLVSDFEAYVQEGAGHNNNLHDNAADWFARAIDWALARFPPE